MSTVRTRFAPSPTGYLHIGGVRTALFCYLVARQAGGQFVLRIDDTDRQRNVEEALRPILDGLKWLGITWDEGPEVDGPHGPYYQSQRGELYREAVERLIASGAAYHDYATTEEIQTEREAAEKSGEAFVYSRRWAAWSDEDRARFEGEGRKAVVRLKMPREGTLEVDDLVRGRVAFDWAREQDHVIQRADGSCLYHLATVVDDHAMEITHVVRAEEHLSNTPRQIFIAEALGYSPPRFAHLPFVAEPGSKVKLSKRKLSKYLKNKDFAEMVQHGEAIAKAIGHAATTDEFNPVLIGFYRTVGYLPEAVVNYLALLGWSLDDQAEHFTLRQLIEEFSLDRVGKSPASFDPRKLTAFQQRHMAQLPVEKKAEMAIPFLEKAGRIAAPASDADHETVRRIVAAAGDRIKVAGDILDYEDFFIDEAELAYDEKALEKRLVKPEDAKSLLSAYRDVLAEVDPFDEPHLEASMQAFLDERQIKVGQIIHAVRVAVTGKAVGVGVFETLAILGRKRSLDRIDQTLARIGS